jgi:hypothetical protein
MAAYLAGGGREAAGGALARVVTIALRSITWPFAGVITDRPAVALGTAMVVTILIAVAIIRLRPAAGDPEATQRRRTSDARWLLGALAVSVVLLAFLAPGLATVTPGLPNDHYHNLLDPVVVVLCAVGLTRLGALRLGGRAIAGLLAAALVAISVTAWPPPVSDDGGWPLADRAAARILETTGDGPLALDGIPPFKNANAIRFPLDRRGATVATPGVRQDVTAWVVVCDPLFDDAVGAACGGQAEDRWVTTTAGLPPLTLLDRFDAGPRRVLSVYAAAPGPAPGPAPAP